ncbi:unnamed protein product, partial [marine sediment metagenome]
GFLGGALIGIVGLIVVAGVCVRRDDRKASAKAARNTEQARLRNVERKVETLLECFRRAGKAIVKLDGEEEE